MRPADDLVDAGLISLVRAAVATLPSFHDESRSTVFEAASLQWPAAPLRIGIKGRELPVAVLMTNFPNGLMEHNDVVTFLHEFGHLMHWIFAGQQSYAAQNVMELENDVIEAPSQLLEERVWDYDTLKRCATNAAGEPIPAALVEKMNRGRRFGEAFAAMTQLGYANNSLAFYSSVPEGSDLTQVYDAAYPRSCRHWRPAAASAVPRTLQS